MKHLKDLLVAYHTLQESNQQYIHPKQAYSVLNMKTLTALMGYLSFAYCMERMNKESNEKRLTFDDKSGELGIWAYMKRNMEYQKADQLYKDKKNMIPTQYKPDLKLLGIPILFFARSNIPKPTDDHRMLNTNQITDTQMAMDVDDFKNNNTNNTNNTHVMGPPPRLEATWSPLMDQTTIYAFPGRGNTYDTLQRGSQRGGDANRGNQIMNIGVDYGGYTRINQRARSRSRSR
eukprot:430673_1